MFVILHMCHLPDQSRGQFLFNAIQFAFTIIVNMQGSADLFFYFSGNFSLVRVSEGKLFSGNSIKAY